MNARRAPERIRPMHLLDQRADVACDGRATKSGLRGTPAPLPGEEPTVPRDDGGGLHDLHGPPPAAPHSREQHPQESVGPTEPEPPWCRLLEDGQLVAERQDLGLEFNASSEAGPHGGDEGNDAWVHTPHGIRRDR